MDSVESVLKGVKAMKNTEAGLSGFCMCGGPKSTGHRGRTLLYYGIPFQSLHVWILGPQVVVLLGETV